MTKYHITPDGPKVCSAKHKCAYGENTIHFDNKKEADAVYEKALMKHYGTTTSVRSPMPAEASTKPVEGNVDKNTDSQEEGAIVMQPEDRDKNVEITLDTLKPREFDVDNDDNVVLPDDLREKVKEEINAGYLTAAESEDGELVMLKYSKSAMFDQRWNEITVNFRGVLVDKDYKDVYARSFPKFFNVSEHEGRPAFPDLPKVEQVVLAKKMDGSLGLITNINGENRVFTNGSARRETNEIAFEGEKILSEKVDTRGNNWTPPENTTVLGEIISPVNPIVVDYQGERRLVVLGAVDNKTGLSLPDDKVKEIADDAGLEMVEKISDGKPMSYQKAMGTPVESGEEGYVLEFQDERQIRAKVKGEEYLQAHRVLTNMSAQTLWSSIAEGKDKELVDTVKKTAPENATQTLMEARENMLAQRNAKVFERENVVKQALDNYNKKHNKGAPVSNANEIPNENMGKFVVELKAIGNTVGNGSRDFAIDIQLAKGNRDKAEEAAFKQQKPKGKVSIVSLVSAEESEVGDADDDFVGTDNN